MQRLKVTTKAGVVATNEAGDGGADACLAKEAKRKEKELKPAEKEREKAEKEKAKREKEALKSAKKSSKRLTIKAMLTHPRQRRRKGAFLVHSRGSNSRPRWQRIIPIRPRQHPQWTPTRTVTLTCDEKCLLCNAMLSGDLIPPYFAVYVRELSEEY
jgi:hypothetical protein